MRCVLVFDVGTGGVHVNVIDQRGGFVATAYEEIRYTYLPDCDGLDWDAEDTWLKAYGAAGAAVEEARSKGADIVAVTVTSQRHGMVMMDDDGRILLACPNLDGRAKAQAEREGEKHGERIYGLTSRWPDVYFPAMRLLWLREKRPADYEKVTRILMVNDYFIYRLTGRIASECTNAAETLLMEVGKLAWSDDMFALFGFDKLRRNDIVMPGDIAGDLSPDIAEGLGVGRVPVVPAVSDTQAAALGTGMTRVGDVVAVNGSTTPLVMIEDHFLKDPEKRIWVDPYIKGMWALESNCVKSGMVHRKLMDHLTELIRLLPGQEQFNRRDLYALLEKVEGRTDGVVSYLGPQRFHVSRGTVQDFHITFPNDETNVFAAILPSFMENLAFAVAANIEQLEAISGRRASSLCLTGGGSGSAHFKKLVPALMPERRVMVTHELETTSRGAAIQCWVGIGEYADADTAVRAMGAADWYETLPATPSAKLRDRYEQWKERFG